MSKRTRASKARSTAMNMGATFKEAGVSNLEIIGRVLAGATGKPAAYWCNVVTSALAAHGVSLSQTKLLDIVPAEEATILLTKLRSEEKGILRWIVEGIEMAKHTTSSQRYKLATYLSNRQN